MKGVPVGKDSARLEVCWHSVWFLTRYDHVPCMYNECRLPVSTLSVCVCATILVTVATTDFQVVQSASSIFARNYENLIDKG